MKLSIAMNKDQTHQDFLLMILLMMTFFFVNVSLEVLAGMKIVSVETAGATSHDAFIAFFGIAVGTFRGMIPQGSPIAISGGAGLKESVITDTHTEKSTLPETEKKP